MGYTGTGPATQPPSGLTHTYDREHGGQRPAEGFFRSSNYDHLYRFEICDGLELARADPDYNAIRPHKAIGMATASPSTYKPHQAEPVSHT